MENFLLNMAVIKVNWDKSKADLLDNYMPLLGYAIKMCQGEHISLPLIAEKLNEVAEFKIPQGAVNILIRRAAKRKYSYISKEGDTFKKNYNALADLDYLKKRDEVARDHMALKEKFQAYIDKKFNVKVSVEEIDAYFFEILFELAPELLSRLYHDEDLRILKEVSQKHSLKYRIAKFVDHLIKTDSEGYKALDSFVKGALLTETFYYSDPLELSRKPRNIKVYFDTQFTLRILGYCQNYYSTPCTELLDMLRDMSVPIHIFRKTYDEIHGVLYAAQESPSLIQKINRPGDVFDYFARTGATPSDIALEIVNLEKNLGNFGITIVESVPYSERLGVDEKKLDEYIGDLMRYQNEKARQHDIDCLTAIFRLRSGQTQKFLDSCKAIFITTNTKLTKASTEFFNVEYGVSDAPVCMSDHIFSTLMWLKAVKKKPDLPKERLVANCYAATNPSSELWDKYINEALKLKEKESITEEDYVVLAHTLEAREELMSITEGESEVFFEGTVPDILNHVKKRLMSEADERIVQKDGQINKLTRNIDKFQRTVSDTIFKIVRIGFISVCFAVLSVGLIFTIPTDLLETQSIKQFSITKFIGPSVFAILLLVTIFNLLFGFQLRFLADWLAKAARNRVRLFLEQNFKG